MDVCFPERALHEVWQRADASRASVATAEGKRFRILYSGLPGGSFGPDFRDAVLEAEDGSEFHGDVEIHSDASDWYAHNHDTDARYGRVIFHAVWGSARDGFEALNSLGMVVPEIGISPLVGGAERSGSGGEAQNHGRGDDGEMVGEWLDSAGDERFAQKIASKRIDVSRFGPDLALQMSIFEGLGYPRNVGAFRHLAQRLPWAFLAGFAYSRQRDATTESASANDVLRARELLRWAAGFDRKPAWSPAPRLEGEAPDWVAAASRPANRPQVRVEAAGHLVAQWWRGGGPLRHVLNALRAAKSATSLRDAFRVENGILGTGRASEIIVNAVLPTVTAWAEISGDGALYRDLMRIYREHPSLPTNSVAREAERALRRRGASIRRIAGARRQQGAMHVYKSMLLRPRAAGQMQFGRRVLSS